jgi:hypothetical protein
MVVVVFHVCGPYEGGVADLHKIYIQGAYRQGAYMTPTSIF